MSQGPESASFAHVTDWVFDLDNTLYPHHSNLFSQIDVKMTAYVAELLKLSPDEARQLQKELYREYGTTLNGLMRRHDIDPDDFLNKVHDIDYSWLAPDPALGAAILALPGRKFIFTNGDRRHAERAARRLGILDHFDDIFDIVAAGLTPKPARETYDKFVALHRIAGPNAVMFEDLARNLTVPKALGMTTVLIVPRNFKPTFAEIWERDPAFDDAVDYVTDDLAGFLGAVTAAPASPAPARHTAPARDFSQTTRSQRPTRQARRLDPGRVSELVVFDLDRQAATVVYETGELIEAPNWSPDGRWLVYNADGRLFRISPDGADGPHRVNTAPIENLNNDHVIAPSGDTIFVTAWDGHLYRVAFAGGAPLRISTEKAPERGFRHYLHGISPDGSLLAYVGLERTGGQTTTRICLCLADGGGDRALTEGGCPVDGPEFSTDGGWIYFNSEAAARAPGDAQIFRLRIDGTGLEQLTRDTRVNWFPHPSPDGRALAYLSYPEGTVGHPADRAVVIRLMALDGSGQRDLDAFNGGQGTINVNSWAPDSRRLAYIRYPDQP
jgi:TolB protein